mmetsp:Transcript_49901/g.80872  ORF Transcript_49901/g.80872 Transcript_49901/m.80872 type:complete len:206 (-) Transcript_49901:137-754(-)
MQSPWALHVLHESLPQDYFCFCPTLQSPGAEIAGDYDTSRRTLAPRCRSSEEGEFHSSQRFQSCGCLQVIGQCQLLPFCFASLQESASGGRGGTRRGPDESSRLLEHGPEAHERCHDVCSRAEPISICAFPGSLPVGCTVLVPCCSPSCCSEPSFSGCRSNDCCRIIRLTGRTTARDFGDGRLQRDLREATVREAAIAAKQARCS